MIFLKGRKKFQKQSLEKTGFDNCKNEGTILIEKKTFNLLCLLKRMTWKFDTSKRENLSYNSNKFCINTFNSIKVLNNKDVGN